MTPNFWFFLALGAMVLLGVTVWATDRGIRRALEVAEDALQGWRDCENHWRNTIAELKRAEDRIAELTQGDEWQR